MVRYFPHVGTRSVAAPSTPSNTALSSTRLHYPQQNKFNFILLFPRALNVLQRCRKNFRVKNKDQPVNPENLNVVSWNIAGAHTIKSAKLFDYGEENEAYFSKKLGGLSPDIICLQETHVGGDDDVAHRIATHVGVPFVYEVDASPSHINSTKRLGNAVISRYKLDEQATIVYPCPEFTLTFADGRPAARHDKVMQVLRLGSLTIANTQMLPLQIFGKSYAEGDGLEFAHQIDELLVYSLKAPAVICGDFNYGDAQRVYPQFFSNLALKDVLPTGPMRPNGAKTDYILTSGAIVKKNSQVIFGEADHYLCFSALGVAGTI